MITAPALICPGWAERLGSREQELGLAGGRAGGGDGADGAGVADLAFDVAEPGPGSVGLADGVPKPAVGGGEHELCAVSGGGGGGDGNDGPGVADLAFDIAEPGPGSVGLADGVPQPPVGGSEHELYDVSGGGGGGDGNDGPGVADLAFDIAEPGPGSV